VSNCLHLYFLNSEEYINLKYREEFLDSSADMLLASEGTMFQAEKAASIKSKIIFPYIQVKEK